MAGRIPQNFIDDLISRTDIVEIVNARVPLKKKGKEHSACCPFHNEKTPSFTVSEAKQFYHCFGCGAHGTALGFLMEYENLDFIDAVEALAAEHNLDVPRESSGYNQQQAANTTQPLYDILEKVAQLFQQQLKTSDKAIEYLRQRGLTGEIAKTYQLGYAPAGWDFLTSSLGTNPSNVNALVATGLLVKKDNGQHYDRYRDRIIFPITDRRGRIIGFGARVIDQGEPKYLNSPENSVFHKGLELYGMFEAKRATRGLEHIIIVEGYMDVVALAQHGIAYAVASLGTATTREQVQKTFRTVPEIIFCYDGDNAGRKAAWRALENTLPIIRDGQLAKFLFLPTNEDPDSMVRKEGKENFEKRLNQATPLSDFLFDTLKQNINIQSADGKAALAEAAKPFLSQMSDSVFKDLLFEKLSTLVGTSTQRLKTRMPSPEKSQTTKPIAQQSGRKVIPNATRTAITLLLQHPELARDIQILDEFATSNIQGLALLSKLHKAALQNPDISSSALLEHWREQPDFEILQTLMQKDIPDTEDAHKQNAVLKDAVQSLINKYDDQRFEVLQTKIENEGLGSLSQQEREEYRRHTQSAAL